MANKLAIQDGTKQLAIGTDDTNVKIADTVLAAATNPKVVFVDETNKVLGSADIPTASKVSPSGASTPTPTTGSGSSGTSTPIPTTTGSGSNGSSSHAG